PERHHVSWNNLPAARFKTVKVPTIFGVARARGYRTAAFFSKAKFQTLQQPGTLDYSQAPGGWFGTWTSDWTVGDIERYLDAEPPDLLFVHLSDPADGAYGCGNYSVIVSADHGGHGRGHGTS